jgi:hypothetical protein
MTIIYDAGDEEGHCAICLSEPRTHVAASCGHFYACAGCTGQQSKCAVCRALLRCFVERTLID